MKLQPVSLDACRSERVIKCVPWQPLSTFTSFVEKNTVKRGHNVSPELKNSSLADSPNSRHKAENSRLLEK